MGRCGDPYRQETSPGRCGDPCRPETSPGAAVILVAKRRVRAAAVILVAKRRVRAAVAWEEAAWWFCGLSKEAGGPCGSLETCLGPAALLPKVGGGRRTPLGRFENVPRLQGALPTWGRGDPPAKGSWRATWEFIDMLRSSCPFSQGWWKGEDTTLPCRRCLILLDAAAPTCAAS